MSSWLVATALVVSLGGAVWLGRRRRLAGRSGIGWETLAGTVDDDRDGLRVTAEPRSALLGRAGTIAIAIDGDGSIPYDFEAVAAGAPTELPGEATVTGDYGFDDAVEVRAATAAPRRRCSTA